MSSANEQPAVGRLAALEEQPHDDELAGLIKECSRQAHMAFVDNHNAGYCINSHTTKLNPTFGQRLEETFGQRPAVAERVGGGCGLGRDGRRAARRGA